MPSAKASWCDCLIDALRLMSQKILNIAVVFYHYIIFFNIPPTAIGRNEKKEARGEESREKVSNHSRDSG